MTEVGAEGEGGLGKDEKSADYRDYRAGWGLSGRASSQEGL
jgi:hypothetical protein